MTRRLNGLRRLVALVLMVALPLLAAGCAAGQAFRQGDVAMRAGNLDEAVVAYRKAMQAEPDNANYRIALERAMLAASRAHLERAKQFEDADQLEAALGEYRSASEFDPSNRIALTKVAALERTVRERAEAARPQPAIVQLRAQAAASSAPPLLNPSSREPIILSFTNANVKDILNVIASTTGINITYDPQVTNPQVTIQLSGLTLEEALNQLMTMNALSYKIVNQRSIFVFPDNAQKHGQYDEQQIRTFYLSHADPTELSQSLSLLTRIGQVAVQPVIAVNKTNNTLTVRATAPYMDIIQRIIQQNDKPRAEIVVDVEILEVDRARTKTYGLNLSEYALGAVLSPEVSPNGTTTGTGTTATTGGKSTGPSGVVSPPPFNLNTISRGVSTADFYLAVPTAIVKFLESDTHTKLVAKPQLRGAEGTKLTLKLGSQIPVISTSYQPIATGGAGVNPLSSYTYKDVGVNIDMTPRVTLEGEILLDLTIVNNSQGPDIPVGGLPVPSFGNREVTTRIRLRDGESNLLAGLLREDESKTVTGFPGAIHVPILKDLFSGNNNTSTQTDIVMLLTPHIVRTTEITEGDLKPIYIGSQQNISVGGPPPLIAPQPEPAAPAAAPPTTAPGSATPGFLPPASQNLPAGAGQIIGPGPNGTLLAQPPGSSPVPGTVVVIPVAPSSGTPAPAPRAPGPPDSDAGLPVTQLQATPPPAAQPPITSPGIGVAQVIISPPATPFRVGGGPYTVPLSITDASRLSTITLTLTFDPTKLRVRTVQEGSFLRSGGVDVTFSQQVNGGRVDITLVRSADATGVSGTGLLAAVLFDAVAPGPVTLTLSGSASGPGGTAMGLRFQPVTINVQQ